MRCKALLLSLAFVGVQSLATADEKVIAKGKELCEQKKCAICHKEGSKTGKPMNQLVQGRTDEYLKGSLVEPKKTIKPDTKMPAYKFNDEEVKAVIDYMKSLK